MPAASLPDGLEMYYEDDDFTDPWSRAETVILHHGNSKNTRLWYAWVPLLSRDFRVIRIDARGFGRSSVPPPGYSWSLDGFAADLRNFMDYLGIDKAHLVGETVGGTFSLQFAYRYPERLHTVTACTSPYKFTGVQTYMDYYKLVKEKGVEAWVRQTSGNRLPPDAAHAAHSEWYQQQMAQTSQQVVLETLAYLSTVDMTPILPQIMTPALVLAGELAGPSAERARTMAELLGNGELKLVPGASGFVQHESPAQCVAIWREFIRKHGHSSSATAG